MCALPNSSSIGTPESARSTTCPPEDPTKSLISRGPQDGTWRAEAGDPPEHAQDNPPPLPEGSTKVAEGTLPGSPYVATLNGAWGTRQIDARVARRIRVANPLRRRRITWQQRDAGRHKGNA